MRTYLEVLSSFDLIITTSARGSDCVSVSVNSSERENLRMSMSIDLGLEVL